MIGNAIQRAFDKKATRGWDRWPHMYWAIDLHDVIIPGTYTRNNEDRQLFPKAGDVLRWLTMRTDMAIILYTSSHEDSIDDIMSWLKDRGIAFNYVNENPECQSNELCSFDAKFYFDIMLEDKAGFEGATDWYVIEEKLKEIGEWQKKINHDPKDN